jgi:hypothetical protein
MTVSPTGIFHIKKYIFSFQSEGRALLKHLHMTLLPANLVPLFATSFCLLKTGPFPGLLRSSSPSGSLRIPILLVFQWIYPASSEYDRSNTIFSF